jgi:hypothetical protein
MDSAPISNACSQSFRSRSSQNSEHRRDLWVLGLAAHNVRHDPNIANEVGALEEDVGSDACQR